jgi:hypothetical protein
MGQKLLYVEPDFIIRNYADFKLNKYFYKFYQFAIEGSL